jgi:hypothetical protein
MAVPFAKPLEITRRLGGYYESNPESEMFGCWVQPDPETVTVRACVQPFLARTDADMQIMQRMGVDGSDGLVRIYSNEEVLKAEAATGTLGDRFTWQGRVYEVCDVSAWPKPRLHWKGFAALVTATIDVEHQEPPEPEPEP